ncbi:hypothetical protein E2562_028093 [Oryza meyeriana var. granulata]|uniref:Uncharacterized protein n=1 Tax=Oryza meyeriana var. granulata TaxID=110450 RepID=A0A6G1C7Z4_9ORYZ|nr:hypothetical protein E2562_028093 [Oryza meyeriana var. granulata]
MRVAGSRKGKKQAGASAAAAKAVAKEEAPSVDVDEAPADNGQRRIVAGEAAGGDGGRLPSRAPPTAEGGEGYVRGPEGGGAPSGGRGEPVVSGGSVPRVVATLQSAPGGAATSQSWPRGATTAEDAPRVATTAQSAPGKAATALGVPRGEATVESVPCTAAKAHSSPHAASTTKVMEICSL